MMNIHKNSNLRNKTKKKKIAQEYVFYWSIHHWIYHYTPSNQQVTKSINIHHFSFDRHWKRTAHQRHGLNEFDGELQWILQFSMLCQHTFWHRILLQSTIYSDILNSQILDVCDPFEYIQSFNGFQWKHFTHEFFINGDRYRRTKCDIIQNIAVKSLATTVFKNSLRIPK